MFSQGKFCRVKSTLKGFPKTKNHCCGILFHKHWRVYTTFVEENMLKNIEIPKCDILRVLMPQVYLQKYSQNYCTDIHRCAYGIHITSYEVYTHVSPTILTRLREHFPRQNGRKISDDCHNKKHSPCLSISFIPFSGGCTLSAVVSNLSQTVTVSSYLPAFSSVSAHW